MAPAADASLTIDVSKSSPEAIARATRELPNLPENLKELEHKDHYKSFPPNDLTRSKYSVFTAGSIEQGKAIDWQDNLTGWLSQYPVTIMNPRRGNWPKNPTVEQQEGQIVWELNALEDVSVVAMFFDWNTKSPISLLELGLYARTGKLVVCCPGPYYRKANVIITCRQYGVPYFDDYTEFCEAIVEKLKATKKEGEETGMPVTGQEKKPQFSDAQREFFKRPEWTSDQSPDEERLKVLTSTETLL